MKKNFLISKRRLKILLIMITAATPFVLEILVLDNRFQGKFWSFLLIPILISITLIPSWKTVFSIGIPFSLLKYIFTFSVTDVWDSNVFLSLILGSITNWTILLVATYFILENIRLQQQNDDTNKKLNEERSFLNVILDTMNEGVLVSDRAGNLVYTNKAFARDFNAVTGVEMQDWLKEYPVYHKDGRLFETDELPLYIALTERRSYEAEMWLADQNNQKKLLHVSGSPLESGAIVLTRDITEQWQSKEKLKLMAFTDSLTGLLNRRAFKEKLDLLPTLNTPHALLFMDCNNFKEINDTYGHEAGDHVLKALSNVLLESTNSSATIGRLAGDEFTILLAYNELEDIVKRIEVIRKGCQKPVRIKNTVINYQVSIGVSLYPQDTSDPEVLLSKADQAMYLAKQKDIVNPYVFYKEGRVKGDTN